MRINNMEDITKQVDNRYEAVRVLSKEARRINDAIRFAEGEIDEKPTTIAINRLVEGKVKFDYEKTEEE